jgi:hypothetical protein
MQRQSAQVNVNVSFKRNNARLSDAERRKILEALRDSADSLETTSAQMKIVEDMRQALYQLVGQTKKDTQ